MGLKQSIEYEIERIVKHPRYLIILTLGVVFSYVFFLSLMQEGQPERLPIGDGRFSLAVDFEVFNSPHLRQSASADVFTD